MTSAKTECALLVEDEPADALLVEAMIEGEAPGAFTVERVATLTTALRRLTRGGVDCVLYDLGLPDAIGLDGLERLREQSPKVAIVVLTGDQDVATGVAAVQIGAQDYLVKGKADAATIVRAISHSIARRRSEQRLRGIDDELVSVRYLVAWSALMGMSALLVWLIQAGL